MESRENDPAKWGKLERIRFLLDRWDEIFDPNVTSPKGSPGDGSGTPRLPHMARHPSVVELARCLDVLAQTAPSLYHHLKAFRCSAEWRQVRALVSVQLTSGRWDKIPGWARERVVPDWINLDKVADAEALLACLFDGEVFIPKDLWVGLTAPAGA